MSRRPRIWCAPPGPVQSPGSTIRSSTRTPSDVVVPTCRPAPMRMWVISRVTVLLPFVPEIEMTGTRRSASRTQVGGAVPSLGDACRPAGQQALLAAGQLCGPRRRHVALGERHRGLRDGPRALLADHGYVTIQCPGSEDRWTPTPAACPRRARARRRRTQATTAAMPSGHALAGTRAPRWTRAWRPGSRWP